MHYLVRTQKEWSFWKYFSVTEHIPLFCWHVVPSFSLPNNLTMKLKLIFPRMEHSWELLRTLKFQVGYFKEARQFLYQHRSLPSFHYILIRSRRRSVFCRDFRASLLYFTEDHKTIKRQLEYFRVNNGKIKQFLTICVKIVFFVYENIRRTWKWVIFPIHQQLVETECNPIHKSGSRFNKPGS